MPKLQEWARIERLAVAANDEADRFYAQAESLHCPVEYKLVGGEAWTHHRCLLDLDHTGPHHLSGRECGE